MIERNLFFASVFTKELSRWKKEHNKSQEAFAGEIGIEPNMITRYKQGKAYPSEITLGAICRVLTVDKSIFFPQTFDERLKYDPAFHNRIQQVVRELEIENIAKAGINLFFWEFLWDAIPNLKGLLPSSIHEVKNGFLFQKKIGNAQELFDQSDLEYIHHLQEDLIDYIRLHSIKYALSQKLAKCIEISQQTGELPTEDETRSQLDLIYLQITQELLQKGQQEASHGID